MKQKEKKKGWNYFFFNFSRYVAVDCELRTDGKTDVSNDKKGNVVNVSRSINVFSLFLENFL